MSGKKELIIGYAPTRRNVFSVEDAIKYKVTTLEKIKSFGYTVVDVEDINDEGLLISDEDINATIKKFKDNEVDCIFTPHCNFGTESAVANVGKEMGKPLLLWGPRDEAPLPDGTRLRDTQCGLFATSKILGRLGVPFTYIINSRLDDTVFERGFNNFAKAAYVVKKFNKVKIGQIGVRPGDFWTVITNEGELLERFNINVIPFNLCDIVNSAKDLAAKPDKRFKETYKFVKENMDIAISDDSLKNLIALKEVIKNISEEQDISAFALQCWTSLQDMLGVVPCMANSLLFDDKIPVACETDINGAITSIIAQAATFDSNPVFFADLTIRHPDDDDSELLWHCGPFPYSLKSETTETRVEEHFILENKGPGTCNWEIKGGDVSVLRFDGQEGKYMLFVGHAEGTTGPYTKGTYLWVKVNSWPEWEEKFIYGPYIHHVAGVHGKVAPVLFEAVKYLKGIELDLAYPDKQFIEKWLRGQSD